MGTGQSVSGTLRRASSGIWSVVVGDWQKVPLFDLVYLVRVETFWSASQQVRLSLLRRSGGGVKNIPSLILVRQGWMLHFQSKWWPWWRCRWKPKNKKHWSKTRRSIKKSGQGIRGCTRRSLSTSACPGKSSNWKRERRRKRGKRPLLWSWFPSECFLGPSAGFGGAEPSLGWQSTNNESVLHKFSYEIITDSTKRPS